eukprot:SAG31_NODE_3759_length_3909_cov_2.636220_7_plen_75_part_00
MSSGLDVGLCSLGATLGRCPPQICSPRLRRGHAGEFGALGTLNLVSFSVAYAGKRHAHHHGTMLDWVASLLESR